MRLSPILYASVCVSASVLCAVSCAEAPVPKPRGYFRIELPEAVYHRFDSAALPYTFDLSSLARVVPDRSYDAQPGWINVVYPAFNCKFHITYRDIAANAREALEDSRRLVYKHTVKADAIGEQYFSEPSRAVGGALYLIRGNAATPMQFALTDSAKRLFRGSVYFHCRPNKDSLAPVIDYVEKDVVRLIESFEWR